MKTINTGFSLSLIIILFLSVDCFAKTSIDYSFVKKIIKSDRRVTKNLSNSIPSDKISRALNKTELKKFLPDLNLKKLTPDIMKVASVGKLIIKKGEFSGRFLNKSSNPVDVIRQYARYGDGYFTVAKNSSDTIKTHLSHILKNGVQKAPHIPSNIIEKFKNFDYTNNKFIDILKRTGKTGYKIIKDITEFAVRNPKKSVAAGLLLWYMHDPEDMQEKVQNVAAYLGNFGTNTASSFATGLGEGVATSLFGIELNSKNNLYFGIIAITIFALFMFKFTRRVIFFPLLLLKIKLENIMDKKLDSERALNTKQTFSIKSQKQTSIESKGMF